MHGLNASNTQDGYPTEITNAIGLENGRLNTVLCLFDTIIVRFIQAFIVQYCPTRVI